VRAALRAEADRCDAVLCRALLRACLDSERDDAALCPSFLKARRTARDRVADVLRPGVRAFAASRFACVRARDGVPFFAGRRTPARRALERPMAIACLVERAPCLPSRT
jgi:hypothetical protein